MGNLKKNAHKQHDIWLMADGVMLLFQPPSKMIKDTREALTFQVQEETLEVLEAMTIIRKSKLLVTRFLLEEYLKTLESQISATFCRFGEVIDVYIPKPHRAF